MNQLTIIGNLVRDPELRTTQSGFNVCTFTVAVNRKAKGEHNSADFFRVSAWRQMGENCHRYLAKGRKVAVVGEVGVNTYTTQNGETRANMEVLAHEVEFLNRRSEEQKTGYQDQQENYKNESGFVEMTDDELFF